MQALPTRSRIVEVALFSFASRGYEATSLDALGAQLGIRKQTILHHFGSKEGLLRATMEHAAEVLALTVESALRKPGTPWDRLERVVHHLFRTAGRRTELVGFLREVARLGPERLNLLTEQLQPLSERATVFLAEEFPGVAPVSVEQAQALVSASFAAVLAYATEAEILRALHVRPNPRLFLRRRRELLLYIADLLGLGTPGSLGLGSDS